MDLLIVSHILTRKDALNLLEVPVRDARHALHFLRLPSHMSILAVRPIDTEAEAVIVALAVLDLSIH